MTVKDLDYVIEKELSDGPRTARQILATVPDECTLSDVEAALRIWERNGWAKSRGILYILVPETPSSSATPNDGERL